MINYSPNRVGIRNTSDYSPFGVELDGRTVSLEGYRFGFQNQEKDDEIKGEGNSINYTFRMHDPRLARFFAVDPLVVNYPFYSSYSFSGNRVVDSYELEGLEPDNIHYYNMIRQKNGDYKAVYHHSNSNLVVKTTNAYFKNSMTKQQFNISKGNYGPQDNTTNVLTYWYFDGRISKQVVVSKDMTNTRLGYSYENNGTYKVGVFETSTFNNNGPLKYESDFSVLSAQATGTNGNSNGGELSASAFQANLKTSYENNFFNVSTQIQSNAFAANVKGIAYSYGLQGVEFDAKAAVLEGASNAQIQIDRFSIKGSISGCLVCAEYGVDYVFNIDTKNKVAKIKIGGELGLILGAGSSLEINYNYK
jgi:hypothetical protein